MTGTAIAPAEPNKLPAPEITKIKADELDNILAVSRTQLLFNEKANFLTALMYRLNYTWCYEFKGQPINTAATNGAVMLFNPVFFENLGSNERVFLIAHELWHVALQHMSRVQDRNPLIWNIAADYVINLLLVEDGIEPGKLKDSMCYDTKYRNMSTEAIYDQLMKQVKKQSTTLYVTLSPDGDPQDGQKGQGKPQPSGSGGQGDQKSKSGGGGSGDPQDGDGDQQGKQPGGLSKEQQKELKDALGMPKNMKLPDDIVFIDPSDEKAKQDIQRNVVSARQSLSHSGKKPGSMPGELELFIEEFLKPTLPWHRILSKFLNSIVDEVYSYKRPNRNYDDPILKGRQGMEGLDKLTFYLDVSGSISDEEVVIFNSEVSGIKRQFNPEEISIVTFDTSIRNVYKITKNDNFKSIRVIGRGGTDLVDVYEHINTTRPDAAVIFTDLYVDIPEDKPRSPLIWVVKGNEDAEVPYGQLIHFDD
ncbi:MAG: hypothetical protein K0U41_06825 [Gammaproteobacteria bacterium]|nr:hypothetical protein [Gammaproteobacteria bacterium]